MKRNPFWLIFLGLIALGIVFYSGYATYKFWQYYRLDRQAPAEDVQWSVVELNDEAFMPKASYRFDVRGKTYEGESFWHEAYLNEWAAEDAIQRMSKESWSIWYDASTPAYSSLEKLFPFKEGFSMISLWIIGLYFVCLDFYVRERFLKK